MNVNNPHQHYSRRGSHAKALPIKPKEPKLTVEKLLIAMPKTESITQRQLARRVNCSDVYTRKVAEQAVGMGLIECFTIWGAEKHYRRLNKIT
jgi:hypothetical protein